MSISDFEELDKLLLYFEDHNNKKSNEEILTNIKIDEKLNFDGMLNLVVSDNTIEMNNDINKVEYDNLYTQMMNFIMNEKKNGITQGDEKWKKRRAYGIGGSQVASVMGLNPYCDLGKYVYDKLKITNMNSRLVMQWGVVFEEVVAGYIENIFAAKIEGAEIFIDRMPLYYSPDGLMINENNNTPECVLLEFKSPYSRIPNGKVPVHYIPQVKMGLEIIDIAAYGLFVEAVFRRCSWEQLGNKYVFDKQLKQTGTAREVIAYGFFAIFGDRKKSNIDFSKSNIIDFGNCDVATITDMFNNITKMNTDNDKWQIEYSSICHCSARNDNFVKFKCDYNISVEKQSLKKLENELRLYKQRDNFVGFMPWKLLRADIHRIDRSPGYLNPYMSIINEIADLIKISEDKTIEERKKMADDFIYKHNYNNDNNDYDNYINDLDKDLNINSDIDMNFDGFIN